MGENLITRVLAATLRVAGSLQKSTEVMQMMQNLVKVPEVAATMRELSKEMMKVSVGDDFEWVPECNSGKVLLMGFFVLF